MVEDSDPVSIGIREWQKVKAAAEEAIERARVATEEASYLRGQCELLTQQHKTDETNLRRLQQHCDEMSLMVDSLGAAVLSVIEKRKAGFFRKAGSSTNGGIERIRPAVIKTDDELTENLREIANTINRGVADRTPATR